MADSAGDASRKVPLKEEGCGAQTVATVVPAASELDASSELALNESAALVPGTGVGGETAATSDIANDASLFACVDDLETCAMGCCCPCILYAQNRERAGLQACLPAAMMVVIPMVISNALPLGYSMHFSSAMMAEVQAGDTSTFDALNECECGGSGGVTLSPDAATGLPVSICARTGKLAGQPPGSSELSCIADSSIEAFFCLRVIPAIFLIYSCVLFGKNRSALQLALGHADGGPLNYAISCCLIPCGQCQVS